MERTGRVSRGESEIDDPGRLPDFLIIGVMKSGTSTLYSWLGRHPDVRLTRPKEPEFFSHDRNWDRGLGWYHAIFREVPPGLLTGEASMAYTKPPTAEVSAQRIHDTIPDVKMIVVLRHPVERVRSQYRHEIQKGREDRPLVEALIDPTTVYLAQSHYHRVLRPYLERFSTEQLLIIRFDDLVADEPAAWDEVLGYLGLSPLPRPAGNYNLTAAKGRDSKLYRHLADRGLLEQKRRVPQRIRDVIRPLLHTEPDDPEYRRQLAASNDDIPGELLAPVWRDVAELEQVLGRELWKPEEPAAG